MPSRIRRCVVLTSAIGILSFATRAWAASNAGEAITGPAIAASASAVDSGSSADSGLTTEQVIKRELANKTKLDLENPNPLPLAMALKFLAEAHHIPIHIDLGAINEAQLNDAHLKEYNTEHGTKLRAFTVPATHMSDISLRSALDLILSPYDLTPVVKDEMLLITTDDKAATFLKTRLYNVRDLVMENNPNSGATDLEGLADAIRQTVNPGSWDKAGGLGSLAAFNSAGITALVVVQTDEGHEKIESLLSELRKLKPQRPAPRQ